MVVLEVRKPKPGLALGRLVPFLLVIAVVADTVSNVCDEVAVDSFLIS